MCCDSLTVTMHRVRGVCYFAITVAEEYMDAGFCMETFLNSIIVVEIVSPQPTLVFKPSNFYPTIEFHLTTHNELPSLSIVVAVMAFAAGAPIPKPDDDTRCGPCTCDANQIC